MYFEQGDLYHIFNQGNNKVPIFYSKENYFFFLDKLRRHILPHADILAWCLMPNHFHLMAYVHTLIVEISDNNSNPDEGIIHTPKKISFNQSIGILLTSYTKAINIQQKRTGSLFREHTHAESLTKAHEIAPSFFNTEHGAVINRQISEKEYPQICFDYIHTNPVKARLVKKPEDWQFSSYPDYCGIRNGKLINKKRTEEFGIIW